MFTLSRNRWFTLLLVSLTVGLLGIPAIGMAPHQDVINTGSEHQGLTATSVTSHPTVAGEGNLVIDNHPLVENSANYHRYIKYLTIAPKNRKRTEFHSDDLQTLRSLESPVRRQIFEAMNENRLHQFHFATLQKADENFTMRVAAIRFMVQIHQGKNKNGVDFSYFGTKVPAQADPVHWLRTGSFAFRTRHGAQAAEAIDGLVKNTFRGDCLGAIEATILQAARKAVGAPRFNHLHPAGLEVGPGTKSVFRHIRSVARFSANDMVPGDWVYMRNKTDYNTDLRPGVRPGYWTGENALFMGRYNRTAQEIPQYHASAPARFSGMGVYDVTEVGLRKALKDGYTSFMRRPNTNTNHSISDGEIRWTELSRLETGD